MKSNTTMFFFLLLLLPAYSIGIGADAAYPAIEKMCEKFPITKNDLYQLNDEYLQSLISEAADIEINFFELIDCLYRYLTPRNMRIEIIGNSLRKLQKYFNYGTHPVNLLLPIEKIEKVQIGYEFTNDQKALDIYLNSEHNVYIDIATAIYDNRCGFKKIEPLIFSEPYGMRIKKWIIVKEIDKIHLYQPGFGAVYAKGFYRPKLWEFWPITRIIPE